MTHAWNPKMMPSLKCEMMNRHAHRVHVHQPIIIHAWFYQTENEKCLEEANQIKQRNDKVNEAEISNGQPPSIRTGLFYIYS